MRRALLYLLAAVFLVAIVSVAWWTREAHLAASYIVQAGDTGPSVADDHGVSLSDLTDANPGVVVDGPLPTGETITIPSPEPTLTDVWLVHLAGAGAELVGVLMSFWLAIMVGFLPRRVRTQVLGISVVLGIASYAAAQAVTTSNPQLTPQFLFAALKDGFAWSAAFPMFARLLGMRDEPGRTDAPPESEESAVA